jgi:hypothetical protein
MSGFSKAIGGGIWECYFLAVSKPSADFLKCILTLFKNKFIDNVD